MRGRGKREIPEKTRRAVASSGTIPTCENPGVARPGTEPDMFESNWLVSQTSFTDWKREILTESGKLSRIRLCSLYREQPLSTKARREVVGRFCDARGNRTRGGSCRRPWLLRGIRLPALDNLASSPADGFKTFLIPTSIQSVGLTTIYLVFHWLLAVVSCASGLRDSGIKIDGTPGILYYSPPTRGEPGSIPRGVAPGFSHVGIVPDDASGRRVFLQGSPISPCLCIPALLITHFTSTLSALKTSLLRAARLTTQRLPAFTFLERHCCKRVRGGVCVDTTVESKSKYTMVPNSSRSIDLLIRKSKVPSRERLRRSELLRDEGLRNVSAMILWGDFGKPRNTKFRRVGSGIETGSSGRGNTRAGETGNSEETLSGTILTRENPGRPHRESNPGRGAFRSIRGVKLNSIHILPQSERAPTTLLSKDVSQLAQGALSRARCLSLATTRKARCSVLASLRERVLPRNHELPVFEGKRRFLVPRRPSLSGARMLFSLDVLAGEQFNVGTRGLVVRSQRDRSTSSLVYGLFCRVTLPPSCDGKTVQSRAQVPGWVRCFPTEMPNPFLEPRP
ncbi:hypothetical protein PR048_001622 [Dryococelus australis]|uniref:Uncharacterized protein n=1 Tax=Dryococelus australis TaxID=614101 RepID=A0ABQ9IHW0_9NEOP|nr:hypothetical protein PR048_001622 [Dryococelus australis]